MAELERIEQEQESPIEVFENDIELYFDEYCEKYKIENMRREKQPVFNGGMSYIYRHYFKGTNKLKSKDYYLVNNSVNNMMTNHNAYDIDLLIDLYRFLQEFANAYDKVASVAAFKRLTGISKQTISAWRLKSSNSSMDKLKKDFISFLDENAEDELKEFNLRFPYGAQEQLNVDYHHRDPNLMGRTDIMPQITMEDLQQRIAQDSGGGLVEKEWE